jgi:hypothetical protein
MIKKTLICRRRENICVIDCVVSDVNSELGRLRGSDFVDFSTSSKGRGFSHDVRLANPIFHTTICACNCLVSFSWIQWVGEVDAIDSRP